MNHCKKFRILFDDAYFGDLTGEPKEALDRHLANCPRCRAEFEANNAMIRGIVKTNTAEPVPGFWDSYTDNLHRRMVSEGIIDKNRFPSKRRNRRPRFTLFSRAWALQSAAAIILLIAGIFIGRYFFSPGSNRQPNADVSSATDIEQIILARTGSFIDRSRVILLGIENFEPETENAGALDLSYQKEISRDLLKQAISLKEDLSALKRRRLEELVSDLEVILLQIANTDSASELETLRLVKNGKYIRILLYKIRHNDLRRSTYKKNDHLTRKI